MSSHDNKEPVGSTVKRIATLNDHEEHILRLRLHAYQKIHHKEIAEVSSQLEEIRESMKTLTADSLYGTHTLKHAASQRSSSRSPASNQGRKSGKLRRTQSFPDLLEGSADVSASASASASNSSFPVLKSAEHHTASRHAYKLGEKAPFNDLMKSRSKSSASHHVHDSFQFGVEANDREEQGHRKLERSKTAPVAMLQPLLKTTPEMMRKRIHISTSNRPSNEELLRRKGISPRFGDRSSRMQPTHQQQTQADSETALHRPKIVSDSHRFSSPTSHSSYESKTTKIAAKDFPSKKVKSRAEHKDDAFLSLQTVKGHENKSSSKKIAKPFHKFKEDLFEASEDSDKEKDVEGLRNCRYLRFAKESQESNRI